MQRLYRMGRRLQGCGLTGMEYDLIRSRRRTLAIEIRSGRVLVRAPYLASKREIDRFVLGHRQWIETHLAKAKARDKAKAGAGKLSEAELISLAIRFLHSAHQSCLMLPAHHSSIVATSAQAGLWVGRFASGHACLMATMP